MKAKRALIQRLFIFTSAVGLFGTALGFEVSPPPVDAGEPVLPPLEAWDVVERSQNTTLREFNEVLVDDKTGLATIKPHRIVEITSGLNYKNEVGEWVETTPLFEITGSGAAAAVRGPHKVIAQPNINSEGAVTLITVDGGVYRTHIMGIFYYDPVADKRVKIANVKNSIGEIQPSNQVVWKSAFDSVDADVRLTYDKSAIEADLIFNELPPPPSEFGLGTMTRIELWHEFACANASPKKKSRPVRAGSASAYTLTDEILDFGDLWFPTGKAYAWRGEPQRTVEEPARISMAFPAAEHPSLEIGKSWSRVGDRNVLIESLLWSDVSELGNDLPTAKLSAAGGALVESEPVKSDAQIRVADTVYAPSGFVWDYISVPGSGTDYCFKDPATAPGTYLVSGATYFSGTLEFQPGCIVKFEPNAYLLTYGSINCIADASNPPFSILTCKSDPRFGEISGVCPSPSASPALWAYQHAYIL